MPRPKPLTQTEALAKAMGNHWSAEGFVFTDAQLRKVARIYSRSLTRLGYEVVRKKEKR